jgi:ankyrin repeat protein
MRFPFFIAAVVLVTSACQAAELTREQRLIVACHRLNVDGVVAALREGANVNSRFGDGDTMLFQDPWSLGWPIAASDWTPLIAVASASDYPDPPRKIENTSADRDWARNEQAKVSAEQIENRRRATATIARILLSHNANIDADDGYGATALYEAIDTHKLELAKVLLRFNAKVNTKTRIYIDGAGNITPLHQAYWSAELTKLLLAKGADPKAKDSEGETPADWARMSDDPKVARLYKSP